MCEAMDILDTPLEGHPNFILYFLLSFIGTSQNVNQNKEMKRGCPNDLDSFKTEAAALNGMSHRRTRWKHTQSNECRTNGLRTIPALQLEDRYLVLLTGTITNETGSISKDSFVPEKDPPQTENKALERRLFPIRVGHKFYLSRIRFLSMSDIL
eukprot:TRINITY_DN507_c0_g2_i1.p1 TRINITY_DN507_c0_g2~~TRINITY_DN507_c0_g2_i1.p1  ORF type:complete len:154 (-),score=4.03 TRINITY_DN507_c0_g2_i1:91-552(-)